MNDLPVPTLAEQVWAECRRGAQVVADQNAQSLWSTRDILIAAIESFAEHWDTAFGPTCLHDPNDVKELARWLREYLHAAGRVPDGR